MHILDLQLVKSKYQDANTLEGWKYFQFLPTLNLTVRSILCLGYQLLDQEWDVVAGGGMGSITGPKCA